MNIGVDIRCLMDKERTGVGEYTYGLLNVVFNIDYTDGEKDYTDTNQYYLFYNSHKDVSQNIPQWKQDNVHYVYTRWPNKLLNLLVWLKIVRLDQLVISKFQNFKISKLDIWFSPNLNFTNLSKHIKRIQTVHDLSFEFFPEYFTLKQRLWHKFLNPKRQCQRADVILTPSENTMRDVVAQFQISNFKFQILRPGVSDIGHKTEDIKKKYGLPEKYILYLGTLEPRKNVETLIQAYKLSAINYKLIIAGGKGWKNKKVMDLITKTEGVNYIGYVDEADKPALYSGAGLFVFPSLYEGFGLPVLEAMAYGVPVITSNRSSLPEVVGDAGCLVDPHNVAEIAEAMKRILSDMKLGAILKERGKAMAAKFDWNKTAKEFLIYLTL